MTWPLAGQVATIAAAGVLVAGIYLLVRPALSWPGGGLPGRLTDVLETLGQVSALVRVSWRLLLEPVAFVVMAAALTLSLGCAALWSVLERVALGGGSES